MGKELFIFITTINPNNLDLNNKLKQEEGWIKGIRKVRNCQLFSLPDNASPPVCFLLDLAGGEDPGKLSHATLKNGHTAPIGSTRPSSPVQVEEELGRRASLRKPVPEEEPKKRLGN